MKYNEILKLAKQGKIIMLPNFIGHFKWNYNTNSLEFINNDFKCPAELLDILNRDDFYYIT